MKKNVHLIGLGSGWGARLMSTGDGPAALFQNTCPHSGQTFAATFGDYVTIIDSHADFRPTQAHEALHGEALIQRTQKVRESCAKAAEITQTVYGKNQFPFSFGGDHSLAAGTWAGIKSAHPGDFGLIWIDAHLDAHTPETTPSHAYHGMPVAALLGLGDQALIQLSKNLPVIKAENLFYIGARSFESEETSLLNSLNVKIFYMEDLQTHSFADIFAHIRQDFKNRGIPYGISLDIDAFDPTEAPGTGVPEVNGLYSEDVLPSFCGLMNDPDLLAFEVLEFNPHLDHNHKTMQLLWRLAHTLRGDKA